MMIQIKMLITQIITYFMLLLIPLFVEPLFAKTIDDSTRLRVDKIIAIVNEEVITQTDVDRVLATIEAEYSTIYNSQELKQKLEQVQENIINQMVEEKLVLSEAKKFDIKIDEENIEAQIEQIKGNFASEEEFEIALELQGLTLKDLWNRFHNQEIMKKAVDYFVRSKIKIEPIEIKQFYQSYKNDLVHPEKAMVKGFLVKVDKNQDEYKALQIAREVLERLRKGDSFEDLVKEYSQGANAQEGGSLGFIEKGEMISEIDAVIFNLKAGEFTDVIKTQAGYRIFKVEEKQPKRPLTFSEAQDNIRQALYRKEFTRAFKKWIDQLKQKAFIQIKDGQK